jgi:microcystin-dependent protein
MSDPYVGEIRLFGGNYAPEDWHLCDGSLLSITQNEALFALIGTTYGGDGQNNFAVPDLRGRVPLHLSTALPLGAQTGSETVTLTQQQIPAHTHTANASDQSANSASPADHVWGASGTNPYQATAPNAAMSAGAVHATGGNQPHENMMPGLVVNYIISLNGIFPTPD